MLPTSSIAPEIIITQRKLANKSIQLSSRQACWLILQFHILFFYAVLASIVGKFTKGKTKSVVFLLFVNGCIFKGCTKYKSIYIMLSRPIQPNEERETGSFN